MGRIEGNEIIGILVKNSAGRLLKFKCIECVSDLEGIPDEDLVTDANYRFEDEGEDYIYRCDFCNAIYGKTGLIPGKKKE